VLAFGYYNFGRAAALGTLVGAALVIVAVVCWTFAYAPARSRGRRLRTARGSRVAPRVAAFARGVVAFTTHLRPTGANTLATRSPNKGERREGALRSSARRANKVRWGLLVGMAVLVLLPFSGEAPGWLGRAEFAGTSWPALETGLANTLAMSAATVVVTLALAVPAAHLLAYKRFRLRRALFLFLLFTLAIPGVIFIYPQFEEIVWLELVNTRAGMLVLYVTANLPLAVFFLRPAFASVPQALVESMRVDGASSAAVLRRLSLKYSASTISALALLIVVWVWGEVPIAQAVLSPSNESAMTLPLLLAGGGAGPSAGVGNPNAAYLISLATPLLVFFCTQRYFRRGLVNSTLLLPS